METVVVQGPKGRPITGNLVKFRQDPLSFLQAAANDFGEVVSIRFGPSRTIYLINNPEMIREVLVAKEKHFKKAKGLQVAKVVVGEGILTSEGEKHLRQRRLMSPFFQKGKVSRYADSMVKHTEKMIERWRDGDERNISQDMMELTLSIITETMFGTDVRDELVNIGESIEIGLHYVSRKESSFLDLPLSFPTKMNRQFQQSAETLDRVIYSIIEKRRNSPNQEREDLLSKLLSARDEADGTGMTDEQVRDEVMTIFLAGHETTANTLSWTWYLLATYPEVEHKFWAELDRVLGGRKPTYEDLENLPYLNHIIQESLRLYPAAWVINREVVEDVEIGNYRFAKGDTLMMSQFVMHRNPDYFQRPEDFVPERFEDDLLKKIPPFAYFPFGGGSRVCIGNHFALMETALILATIGQKYELQFLGDPATVEPEPLVTLRPKNGIPMTVKKRK